MIRHEVITSYETSTYFDLNITNTIFSLKSSVYYIGYILGTILIKHFNLDMIIHLSKTFGYLSESQRASRNIYLNSIRDIWTQENYTACNILEKLP